MNTPFIDAYDMNVLLGVVMMREKKYFSTVQMRGKEPNGSPNRALPLRSIKNSQGRAARVDASLERKGGPLRRKERRQKPPPRKRQNPNDRFGAGGKGKQNSRNGL